MQFINKSWTVLKRKKEIKRKLFMHRRVWREEGCNHEHSYCNPINAVVRVEGVGWKGREGTGRAGRNTRLCFILSFFLLLHTYCFFAPSSPCNINRTFTVSMGIVMHSATATETHELKKSTPGEGGGFDVMVLDVLVIWFALFFVWKSLSVSSSARQCAEISLRSEAQTA